MCFKITSLKDDFNILFVLDNIDSHTLTSNTGIHTQNSKSSASNESKYTLDNDRNRNEHVR